MPKKNLSLVYNNYFRIISNPARITPLPSRTWKRQKSRVLIFNCIDCRLNREFLFDTGDNVDCWMEIQHGKGPWAPPVNGIVQLGNTLTLVVAINDYRGK